MPLIKEMQQICSRLAPLGWADLLAAHGLDITSRSLAKELAKPLKRIDRSLPGFQDFCREGVRGIEPGVPSRSLFYHALASPAVTAGPRGKLRGFPTLAELEMVENYIFACRKASLADITALAKGASLAVAVFACEYRVAARTAHRRYADLSFSRTGLARIGTAPPRWDGKLRGFSPVVAGKPNAMRVSPTRYVAYLAVQLKGDQDAGRPMRYQKAQRDVNSPADNRRTFWVPLHKLFDGPECLTDVPKLAVGLQTYHANEKLRRIHLVLNTTTRAGKPFRSGWTEPDISRFPFRITEGIAEFRHDEGDPPNLLVPVPHKTLIEGAVYRGKPLGYNVPSRDGFVGSLDLPVHHNSQGEEIRPCPAYVHARTKMTADGEVDLNQFSDAAQLVDNGGYVARHYIDYTGDGWVKARVTGPSSRLPVIPAYSLVTAPDFLYACDQAEVSDWTDTLPKAVRSRIWYIDPMPLSDMRLPANLQMPKSPFLLDDDTITAIVPLALPLPKGQQSPVPSPNHPVHTSLPDDAAGIMAPGWDVARDWLPDKREHLAAYGLGSPFPEDSKLCAAFSAFWPAVAPDATREFAWTATNNYRTITPLTDEEIGVGDTPPWDGVPPPRLVRKKEGLMVQFTNFAHADYALSALAGKMTFQATGLMTQVDFQNRTLAMAMAYQALGLSRFKWMVLSYRQVAPDNRERLRAEKATRRTLQGTAHRFVVCRVGHSTTLAKPPFLQEIVVRNQATLLIDAASGVVLTNRNGAWTGRTVSL